MILPVVATPLKSQSLSARQALPVTTPSYGNEVDSARLLTQIARREKFRRREICDHLQILAFTECRKTTAFLSTALEEWATGTKNWQSPAIHASAQVRTVPVRATLMGREPFLCNLSANPPLISEPSIP